MSTDTDLSWLRQPIPSAFDCYTKEEARQDATRIARYILNHQHQLDTTQLDHTTAMKAVTMRHNIGNRPVPPPPQMW